MTLHFCEKLDHALKALTLTRGQLAAELGLHKSVVARWLNGSVVPSAYNLQRLTSLVARRSAGFTILDWEKDLPGLSRALGVGHDNGPPIDTAYQAVGLNLAMLAPAAATTALRGGAYEGFYRSTRPISQYPGRFVYDYLMVRMGPDGLLRFDMQAGGVTAKGYVLLLQSQLFIVCEEMTSGALAFGIFNGVNLPRAGTLDGLILICALDLERSPTASAMIMQRIGDLTGEHETDDAFFASLGKREFFARTDELSEDLKSHLVRDVGPTAFAAGGDWVLRLPLSRSRSAGEALVSDGSPG